MKILLKVSISMLVLAVIGAVILLPVGNNPAAESLRAPAEAQTDTQSNFTTANGIFIGEPVEPELTIALRDAPIAEIEFELDREINPRIDFTGGTDPSYRQESGLDPLLAVQDAAVPSAVDEGFTTPVLNFNGMASMGATPPDTVGDVGINEYIQMVNGSMTYLTIYDKTDGSVIAGPIGLETLGSGGNCASGGGDPIVLYDELADKWMLSEFASSGNYLCIYISTTPDPTGTYWRYVFTTPSFPDYPKYAVWPDAYYMTANEGPSIYALDRANMIIGATARAYQRYTAPGLSAFGFETLTPADHDGDNPPPAGSPGIIMRHIDTEAHSGYSAPAGKDFLDMWAFHVDWTTPSNSTFTRLPYIEVSDFTSELCGYTAFNCFPQQGSSTTLDPLREVIMWRLQYRNFGSYETLVGNLVTDVDGANRGGIRWFELRKIGAGAWSLYQEGTYAPSTDTHSRWMGAISMDGSGNIAVGYNTSSSTMYPSLRYVGRLRSDDPGSMLQGEVYLANGTAPSPSNRYGDYAAMSVDPVDDCTFWFTGEYNTGGSWSTKIGAFRFDACTGGLGPDFALEATPASQTMCTPETAAYELALSPLFGFDTPITLTAYGVPAETIHAFSPNPATPPLTATLSISTTSLTAAGSYTIDIVGTTATRTHTATVTLDLYTPMLPTPVLLSPAEGADNQSLVPAFDWADQNNTTSYNFTLGTSPLFDDPLVTVTNLTASNYSQVDELQSGVCYWWSAQAANMCAVGDWAETYHFATILYYTAFEDDIENGSSLWSHSATVGADEWAISDLQSNSPSHAWYVPNAGVKTDSALRLSSAAPAGEGSLLIFWHRYEFEGANNDGSVLEISTNNGGTWLDLGPYIIENGYNGTLKAASNNPLHGRPGFVGDLTTWTKVTVDLSAFAGQDVLVRWRFGADGGNSDVGWFIDDVRILSPMPANPTPEVLTLTPASGAPGISIPIVIAGSGFLGSPALRLGDTWLEDVTVADDTHLNAIVPAGLPHRHPTT